MKRRARLGFRWNRAQEKYVKREAKKNLAAEPARVITFDHHAYPAVDEDVRVRSFAYAADLLADTEVLVDTGCSRSMGSRQRADRLCRAAAARLGRTSTSAPSNRSYTVGGDSQIVADELRKVPGRLAGRDVTVSFEVGDFGDQPLLLGENAPRRWSSIYRHGKPGRVYSRIHSVHGYPSAVSRED